MKNMKNIIDLTLDAITASGKRFSELQRGNVYVSTKKWCLKEDTNNMIKLAIFVIIPEIKYIQVHQYSKHQKAPRTMYQISILHPMSKIRIKKMQMLIMALTQMVSRKENLEKSIF
jgi:hypothetical protein